MILYGILGLLLLFLIVLGVNTAIKICSARKLSGKHPEFTSEELAIYGRTLQQMLRCKTISVKESYDDTEFAKLREVVKEAFPLLHEKAERMYFSQDCWVYKIPGKDTSRNILLMSHHDVVKADETWSHDPFGGEIEDGKIILRRKTFRHRSLEERAAAYGGKLGPYTEYDWGEPEGREVL